MFWYTLDRPVFHPVGMREEGVEAPKVVLIGSVTCDTLSANSSIPLFMVCSIVATCLWIDPDIELFSTVGDDGGGSSVVGLEDGGKRNPCCIIIGQFSIVCPIMFGGLQHKTQLVCVFIVTGLVLAGGILADPFIAESFLLSSIKEVGGTMSCHVSLLESLAD